MKDRIISIARETFSTYGYSHFSMVDLAKKIGISKKTLYKYFAGKEAILRSSFETFYDEITKGIKDIIESEDLNTLEIMRNTFAFVGEKLSIISPYYIEDIQRNAHSVWIDIEKAKADTVFHTFDKLLDKGQKEGLIKKNINKTLIVILYANAIDSILSPSFTRRIPNEMMKNFPYSPTAVFEGLNDIIFQGIVVSQ